MKNEMVMVIPDLQIPFEHRDAFDFLREVKNAYQPSVIVCIGDEIDFHALSDFDADPDGFSAGHEMRKALKTIKPLYRLFPEVLSCTSNHTVRPFRRAFKSGLPRHFLRSYSEFMQAPPGWTWKDHFIVDGVRYEHGHNLGGGMGKTMIANAQIKNQRSTVFGHFHANAGIQYLSSPESLMWAMNVGCLIDSKSYAFAYAVAAKSRPILGCGIVDRGIPTFLPMLLNKRGTWVGELRG